MTTKKPKWAWSGLHDLLSNFKFHTPSRHCAARLLVPASPSVRPRKLRPWRDIAILACPPPPAPPTSARSRSAPVVRPRRPPAPGPRLSNRPTVHVSHAPGQIHNPIIIYRFLYWHTLRSVAMMTTSRQWALSDALHHAEFSPRFTGLRSFSIVRNQEVAARPGRKLQLDVCYFSYVWRHLVNAIGQPTRPTQPVIHSGSIDD